MLTSTVKRRLRESGLFGRIATVQETNVEEAKQSQKMHEDLAIEQWNKTLGTDESNFKIFGSNRRVYVRRRVGERAATPLVSH